MGAVAILADAAPGPATVTLITGILLAVAAIVSALTPVILARRRSRKEALAAATAASVDSGSLTLAGWSTLNQALQQEITRLQGVVERQQARADLLESEMAELRKLALSLQKGSPGA